MSADKWLILNSGRCDYALNMGIDEALMEAVSEIAHPVLRFYGWEQAAASFGYFQHISEIEVATSLRPLVRRPTGGGLVPHDRDWTYSVVIPPQHSWYQLRANQSYEQMHAWIRDAFLLLGVQTELAPCCRKEIPGQCFAGYEQHDLLWFGRKIAGAAQRRAKSGLLIQGSIQSQPQSLSRCDWENGMASIVRERFGIDSESWIPSHALLRRATDLQAFKYSRDSHNRKR